jgi:trehalose-phosphatase
LRRKESGDGLQVLNAEFDEAGFFDRLVDAPTSVLLLDYDGTLAPFAPQRERAYAYHGILELLAFISRDCRTRLAIVSGRPLLDLVRLVGPGLELWASQGIEHRRRDGVIDPMVVPRSLTAVLDDAMGWIEGRGWGAIVERKPFGLALHARPNRRMYETAEPSVVARWSELLRKAGLETFAFDGGVEFRPAATHKGHVVERILEETGPGVPVAYLGDDRSDEEAFRKLRGLGLGVRVHPRLSVTLADAWLQPPQGIYEFLNRWAVARLPSPAA